MPNAECRMPNTEYRGVGGLGAPPGSDQVAESVSRSPRAGIIFCNAQNDGSSPGAISAPGAKRAAAKDKGVN
jgi:hypothetical protein